MGMYVDEAGGDDLPRDVDLARTHHLADDPDRGDTVAGDRHISPTARPAAAVDHLTAVQNPIGHADLTRRTRRSLRLTRNDTQEAVPGTLRAEGAAGFHRDCGRSGPACFFWVRPSGSRRAKTVFRRGEIYIARRFRPPTGCPCHEIRRGEDPDRGKFEICPPSEADLRRRKQNQIRHSPNDHEREQSARHSGAYRWN